MMRMTYCPKCHRPLPARGESCPHCGADIAWWMRRDGEVYGPCDLQTVWDCRHNGRIVDDDYVKLGREGRWLPLACCCGLPARKRGRSPAGSFSWTGRRSISHHPACGSSSLPGKDSSARRSGELRPQLLTYSGIPPYSAKKLSHTLNTYPCEEQLDIFSIIMYPHNDAR